MKTIYDEMSTDELFRLYKARFGVELIDTGFIGQRDAFAESAAASLLSGVPFEPDEVYRLEGVVQVEE